MLEKLQKAVVNGAAYLDANHPGWHNCIDTGNLNLASGSFCVLGQMFVQYDNFFDQLEPVNINRYNADEYGFMVKEPSYYPTLTQLWLVEIMARRKNERVLEQMRQTAVQEAEDLAAEMKTRKEEKELVVV